MKTKAYFENLFPPALALVFILNFAVSGCERDDNKDSDQEDIDVAGTWIQTDPCSVLLVFELTQDGENITGTARETPGEEVGPLTGTINGTSVFIEVSLPADYWFRYNLTVTGDKMSGTWTSKTGMSGSINMEKE